HETRDPPAPCGVGVDDVDPIACEVDIHDADVANGMRRELFSQKRAESTRTFDGDHAAGGAHVRGEIERRESRSAADVDGRRPESDAGASPRVEHMRTPDTVLDAETNDLSIRGPEHVVVISNHVEDSTRPQSIGASRFLRAKSRT